MVHGGWPPRHALFWNAVSALTFPLGGLVAWALAHHVEVAGLVLFAAGNFVYIAASDLIPEIKARTTSKQAVLHFACFGSGVLSMLALAWALDAG